MSIFKRSKDNVFADAEFLVRHYQPEPFRVDGMNYFHWTDGWLVISLVENARIAYQWTGGEHPRTLRIWRPSADDDGGLIQVFQYEDDLSITQDSIYRYGEWVLWLQASAEHLRKQSRKQKREHFRKRHEPI